MELLNAILKRNINLSLIELLSFVLFGLGFYSIFQNPQVLSFLNSQIQQKDIKDFPANVFFIISWFLLYSVFRKMISVVLKYLLSFRKYSFRTNDWPRKWERQGNIRLWDSLNDSLYITDSNSGCILKYYYWKNLEISFKCMFPPTNDDQTFGIIFRAKSLSDYLMVQINNKEQKIVPHIRVEGRWETMRLSTYGIQTNFEPNVSYEIVLRVINEKVELLIDNTKQLDWIIPTHTDLSSEDRSKPYVDTIIPKIYFRTSYGMIGFRAYQGENVVIKNLSVKRIAGIL